MNFLPCAPVVDGDTMELHTQDGVVRLRLPDELRQKVGAKMPKTVDLGIRPVHLEVVQPSDGEDALALNARVRTYESLGEEGQLSVDIGAYNMLVVTPPGLGLKPGDPVTLQPRPDRIHLFDGTTQAAL